ncbi:DUF2726 domain-containing protein [Pandoraea bronchicola]|nr:DUF2726 domain-containing protein [Pandoraea bronchicola]
MASPREDESRQSQPGEVYARCRRDFSVVAAIELGDPSHDRERQKTRDEKKDAVMKAIGVRLIRFDVRRYPSEFDVRRQVLGENEPGEGQPMAA